MSKFEPKYVTLADATPELGRVAVLDWDAELFGFAVGAYWPAAGNPPTAAARGELRKALLAWMRRSKVEVVVCNVPAGAHAWLSLLGLAGFVFVDLALTAFARRLDRLPLANVDVRPAVAADTPALAIIAQRAFRFGRYHADVRFPQGLANYRYQHWITAAVASQSDCEYVFVSGPEGSATGFVHAMIKEGVADIRLLAVSPEANKGLLGPAFFVSALHELTRLGARQAKARLSAGNTPVLNLYSSLGFSFSDAEAIFHLHDPDAPHLLPLS
jgi:ribosomal protein S18 acetylase RimI-like enzyme